MSSNKNTENQAKNNESSPLQIQIDDDVAQGLYANLTMVNHTETEFVFDFIYIQPQQPRARVRARIISNAKHAKRLMLALKDNIDKYEQKYGIVDISEPPQTDVQSSGPIH